MSLTSGTALANTCSPGSRSSPAQQTRHCAWAPLLLTAADSGEGSRALGCPVACIVAPPVLARLGSATADAIWGGKVASVGRLAIFQLQLCAWVKLKDVERYTCTATLGMRRRHPWAQQEIGRRID